MSNNFIIPDVAEDIHSLNMHFGRMFLDKNGLEIGDAITANFSYQKLVYDHRGRNPHTVTFDKPAPGFVRMDKIGIFYLESKEQLPFYTLSEGKYSYKPRTSCIYLKCVTDTIFRKL